jgi:hypothetical protein
VLSAELGQNCNDQRAAAQFEPEILEEVRVGEFYHVQYIVLHTLCAIQY